MTASNTRECFTDQVGKRVVGVLFDACPSSRPDLKAGNTTIVFDDGAGLTVCARAHWVERPEEIQQAIAVHQRELERRSAELKDVLRTAGALLPAESDVAGDGTSASSGGSSSAASPATSTPVCAYEPCGDRVVWVPGNGFGAPGEWRHLAPPRTELAEHLVAPKVFVT